MKKERITLPLSDLQLNKGQIDWLPKNPRKWTEDSMERMIRSLDEDPDFMEDRPPLVVPLPGGKGKFVVFGGNERVEGEKRRGAIEALECYVYIPEDDNDRQTIIRRSAKDNGHYGTYDWDIYANEWADFPMEDWGAPGWWGKKDEEAGDTDPLASMSIEPGPKAGQSETGKSAITFVFDVADAETVNKYIDEHGKPSLTEQIVQLCLSAEAK